jgi:hypothetical protein
MSMMRGGQLLATLLCALAGVGCGDDTSSTNPSGVDTSPQDQQALSML